MNASSVYWFALLCSVPLALGAGLSIGALILQAACAFCGVEDLRFLKAVGLVLLLALLNVPIAAAGYALARWGPGTGTPGGSLLPWAALPLFVLDLILSGAVLGFFLPAGYFRAVRIALMQLFITLVAGGVLGGLVLAVLGLLQMTATHQPAGTPGAGL